jgi:hypothetical protein
MALITPTTGTVGERAIAYVDHIGRLEGVIARVYPDGLPRASATSSPPN